MWSLIKKEWRHFITSSIGALVMGVFLLVTSLFLWIFEGDFNVLDSGYAQLDGLFVLAPWVFLILIPAISMGMIAEERKLGTLELLLTRPLSIAQIIGAKYLAGMAVISAALLPTAIYVYSVYQLGTPVGNLDSGGILGSYIGLMALASGYLAIGLFSSSITKNQIAAFILAVFLSFFFYMGIDTLADFKTLGTVDYWVEQLGMAAHYRSMSRGLIDTRDATYFVFFSLFFLSMAQWAIRRSWGGLHGWMLGALTLWLASGWSYTKFDLTQDGRYTLSPATLSVLDNIDEPVLFRVYLEGEFPSGFRKLRDETSFMINTFRSHNPNIEFEWIDPYAMENEDDREGLFQQLVQKGLTPFQLEVRDGDKKSEQVVFPGGLVYYKGREASFSLLKSQIGASPEQQINNSIQNLEFELIQGIDFLSRNGKKEVAFLEGHGELNELETEGIAQLWKDRYGLNRFNIRSFRVDGATGEPDVAGQIDQLKRFDALVIAKPITPFNDLDLYLLDQYVMSGGRILWLVDGVRADMDSLAAQSQFVMTSLDLNLSEMLFKYGVRINSNAIRDLQSAPIALVTQVVANTPQYEYFPWPYFPLLTPGYIDHPITRNLNGLKTAFVSTIDTIKSAPVQKSIILQSSELSKIQTSPGLIRLAAVQEQLAPEFYTDPSLPCGVLLEGRFPSVFKNRLVRQSLGADLPMDTLSKPTAQIVLADGDLIRNQVQGGQALPLGYDKYAQQTFGNGDYLLNCMEYLLGEGALMSVRSRSLTLRMLNPDRIKKEGGYWKALNTAAPLGLMGLFVAIVAVLRRKRYVLKG